MSCEKENPTDEVIDSDHSTDHTTMSSEDTESPAAKEANGHATSPQSGDEVDCKLGLSLPRRLQSSPLDTSDRALVDSDVEAAEAEEDAEPEVKASKCATAWRYYKLLFVSVSLILAAFDLGADWFTVKDFHLHDPGGDMTIALTFFIGCSSVLFFLEAYNGVVSVRVYGLQKGNRDQVELWREFLGLGLLLLEDLPSTIILFNAFKRGNCDLYRRIFQDSTVAWTSLLASFISSVWKGVLSLKYCTQVIFKENYTPWKKKTQRRKRLSQPYTSNVNGVEYRQSGYYSKTRSRPRPSRQVSMTWQDRLFCCACVRCRPLRIMINVVVCIVAATVFLTVYRADTNTIREDCPADTSPAQSYNGLFVSTTSSLYA